MALQSLSHSQHALHHSPAHIIHADVWMESKAAFEGASAVVVLHPVRVEDLNLSVVARDVQLHV